MLYVRPNTVQTVLFHNWIKLVQIFAQITSFKIISSNINFEDFDFASLVLLDRASDDFRSAQFVQDKAQDSPGCVPSLSEKRLKELQLPRIP